MEIVSGAEAAYSEGAAGEAMIPDLGPATPVHPVSSERRIFVVPQNDYTKWKSQFHSPTDEQMPDTKYCVSPLLALPSLSIIYGMPGSLKTNLILDLAVDIASNRTWLL